MPGAVPGSRETKGRPGECRAGKAGKGHEFKTGEGSKGRRTWTRGSGQESCPLIGCAVQKDS